jgi:hypothetical protein
MVLFINLNFIQLISLWVILSAANILRLFTATIIKVIFPFENNKNILFVYLRSIIEILIQLPSAGIGILAYFAFKNFEACILIFCICSILTVVALLYMSEAMFVRLELNN